MPYYVLCRPCEIVAISLKINDYIPAQPAKVQVQGIRQIFWIVHVQWTPLTSFDGAMLANDFA